MFRSSVVRITAVLVGLLVCVIALFVCAGRAGAQQAAPPPTNQPILRIETGMHTAQIKQIAVDKAGRYLVTASYDKTLRVWDAKTGTLIRTIRSPIGDGNEGQIYAVAITPDGNTVICGGFTVLDSTKNTCLYFFDRASGALVRRITGLPEVTNSLAVSPAGTLVAATLQSENGVRVFRIADGSLVGSDTKYDDGSYGVDFDAQGQNLVTTCLDGFIRYYTIGASGLHLVAKRKAPGGKHPFSIRFSPDGTRLAVGYRDNAHVSVLSANNLSLRFSPNTVALNNSLIKRLDTVCWSADGQTLFAGGNALNANLHEFIRRWSNAGAGAFNDTPVADNSILDLQTVGDTLFYASGEPTLGALDVKTRTRRWRNAAQTLDLLDTTLALERDAIAARFSYTADPKKQARFNITRRELLVRVADNSKGFELGDLTALPKTTAAGLVITNWEFAYGPKRNGKPIPLEPYEKSRSLGIAPDGTSFVLGTELYIRCFKRDGTEHWEVTAPSVVCAVNVSGDGKVAAAALGDGTIRWYRMTDGQELCALFVHADLKRWVLWTPSGYYDCSPGGEDLIGWHVNRGADKEADFFSASQFRDTFYRPDVLAQVIKTGSEADAVRVANAARGGRVPSGVANADTVARRLPPVLTLADKEPAVFSTSSVHLRFAVRTPTDAPVVSLMAFVDGRPVPVTVAPDASEITVPVQTGNRVVSLLALNKNAASHPVVVTIPGAKGTETSAAPASEFAVKPKLYVLAVGINNYAQKERNLDYAANDAADFAKIMQAQQSGLYETVTVKVLTNADASRDNVVDGLEWIRKQTTSKDVAMILFSGHGANNSDGDFYFLTHNFDDEHWERTAVSFDVIKNTIPRIAGKVIFFLDSCHSGNVLGTQKGKGDPPDIVRLVNELSSAQNGVIVFTACTGRQVALEDPKWGHGAFTKAVLEGIGGEADYRKTGRITVKMLDLYVSERVKTLTDGRQTPTTPRLDAMLDFPVAVKP